MKIHILDLKFQGFANAIASFLIETSEGPIIIESGPYSTYQQLIKELAFYHYQPQDIKHVFLTHIHFDHAGAAWALAQLGAKIYVHPFGAQNLIDPTKLVDSARRIYQDKMDSLWGDMKPLQTEQVHTVGHGEKITIGEVALTSWHTPGHAKHHIAWQINKNVFTGDVGGVKIDNGPVVPPCPPPDINIEDWINSIQLMIDLKPENLYLTHFGKVDPEYHFNALLNVLNDWSEWMLPFAKGNENQDVIVPKFMEYTRKQLIEKGVTPENVAVYEAANPSWMSVAGLMRYWTKKLS